MADRRPAALDHTALEAALRDVGSHLAYPPTPDLATAVRRRLAARPAPSRRSWAAWLPLHRRLAVALAALLVLAGAALAFSPEARTAVAERLGLRGVWIEHLPWMPTPPPGTVGPNLDLGDRVTLEEARARVGFPVLLPTLPELGAPDEVYLGSGPAGGQVALVYWTRPGLPPASETGVVLLLVEFRAGPGTLSSGVLGKGLGLDTRIAEVAVNGGRGVWIEGAPHLLFLPDARGQFRQEPVRVAGNVLLWEQGELTLRIEGALSQDKALRIAASVR